MPGSHSAQYIAPPVERSHSTVRTSSSAERSAYSFDGVVLIR
ncbi:hypothetical protein CLOSTMETH_01668 [[Clostridium] methylpentosum DSM 5476]|uniref:Uncharacterized protein n=1 Tax=[Clostridium] methylpentosum DSM 5476 TaxID=537013 RepID=C0ECU7_9FIRM|nr:hypothetical protein CLOSTMETH_01668 [[Clostridium] methylpentosum DSM 5476]